MDKNVTLKDNQRYTGQILGTDGNNQTKFIRTTDDGFTIVDDVDNAGRNSFNGIFGTQLISHRNSFISANFYYEADTNAYIEKHENLGYHDFDNNLLRLNTGASENSKALLRTLEVLRYRAGQDAEGLFTCIWSEPKTGLTQLAGIMTQDDGFFIGFIENEFGVGIKKDGIITHWATQDNFNGDRLNGLDFADLVLNPSFMNIFRINYGYLGIAPVFYEIWGNKYGWINFHTIDLTNTQPETHISNPYLPAMAYIENTTNTTNESIRFGSISASTFNGIESRLPDSTSREFTTSISKLTVSGANAEEPVLVVHNKATYKGKQNYIKSILINLSASVIGTKPVTLRIKKLKTPVTDTFIDVHTENSTLEYSTTAIPTQTQLDNGEILLARELSKEGIIDKDTCDLNLNLYPDEYVVFTFASANETDIKLSIRESERF